MASRPNGSAIGQSSIQSFARVLNDLAAGRHLAGIQAKIDTGARTSALPYNRHVRVNRAWRSRSSAMLPRPLRAAA